jgi:hydrogenase maturation protease
VTAGVIVVGVGNEWRGDDGIGLAVARNVASVGGDLHVVESDGEPGRVIELWSGAALAIVVDAVRTGAPPGTVHVWDDAIPSATGAAGTHSLGVAEALALGKAVDRLPARVVVVGIEVDVTELGRAHSAAATAALGVATEAVLAAVQAGSKAMSSGDG